MEWLKKLRGKSGGMIKNIDHAAILVSDMDRALEFYSGVLGLKLIQDGRGAGGQKKSFLGTDKKVLIALAEDKNRGAGKAPNPGGVDHIAFLVDDLEQSSRLLSEKGVKFIEEKKDKSGKTTAYHFLDPDGLELEICATTKDEVPQY